MQAGQGGEIVDELMGGVAGSTGSRPDPIAPATTRCRPADERARDHAPASTRRSRCARDDVRVVRGADRSGCSNASPGRGRHGQLRDEPSRGQLRPSHHRSRDVGRGGRAHRLRRRSGRGHAGDAEADEAREWLRRVLVAWRSASRCSCCCSDGWTMRGRAGPPGLTSIEFSAAGRSCAAPPNAPVTSKRTWTR